MSTTQQDTTTRSINDAVAKARAERGDLVSAIRALADLIEQHPELPAPRVFTYAMGRTSGEELVAAGAYLRQHGIGHEVRDNAHGSGRVEICVPLGTDVTYNVDAKREDVCTPRVDGRSVTWDLPDGLRTEPADDAWAA